jgi:hypothetical protein
MVLRLLSKFAVYPLGQGRKRTKKIEKEAKRTVKPASGALALQLEQQHGRATQTVTAVLQNRAMADGHGFRPSTRRFRQN